MEFEVQDVVNNLATRIGQLEVELAMSNAKNKKLDENHKALQQEVKFLHQENARKDEEIARKHEEINEDNNE